MILVVTALLIAAPASAEPYKLVVELPDGSSSETAYPSEGACEQASRAMMKNMEKRKRLARRKGSDKPKVFRWMIGPSCFPM
ncbi:MAG: hypothetical protein E6G94_00525 [Alphaproteobacteria bacterium]|nr:MAG: hypothetical protein E6G94_00525 [Alphaproteobacteria bacterium]